MNLQWVSIHHKAKAFVNYVYTFSFFCTRTKNIIYTLIMSIYTQLKLNTGLFLKGRGKKKRNQGANISLYIVYILNGDNISRKILNSCLPLCFTYKVCINKKRLRVFSSQCTLQSRLNSKMTYSNLILCHIQNPLL